MLISRTSSGRGEFEKLLATMDEVLFTMATLENAVLIDIAGKDDQVTLKILGEFDILCRRKGDNEVY